MSKATQEENEIMFKWLAKNQRDLVSYWVMEASATTAKEDMEDIVQHFILDVGQMSDREARLQLVKELE